MQDLIEDKAEEANSGEEIGIFECRLHRTGKEGHDILI